MKNVLFVFLIAFALTSTKAQPIFSGKPRYDLTIKRADTLMGVITVEMFPAIAPNHVRNWDSLVNIKFYDSTAFHRVIPGFMIQGGDPNSRSGDRSTWGYGDPTEVPIHAEFNSVSHRRGIISAARTDDPNSATSQFFICIANPTYLDREYTVYGKVVSGMSVADSIVKSKRDAEDNPLDKISMFITRTDSNDSVTAVPTLVSPINDSIVKSTKVTFRWNKVPGAMMYNFQLAYDSGVTDILVDSAMRQVDTSVTINNLSDIPYYWRVMANNGGNASEYSPTRTFFITGLSAEFEDHFNISFDVYPNPAKESTMIGFNLSKPSNVTLTVLDMLGRNVVTLIDSELMPQGKNEVSFTRGSLPAGMYIYRLEAEGRIITKRLVFE